jgi:fructose-bisphosphate aldolase class II
MIAGLTEVINEGKNRNIAIGSFNTPNLECLLAVLDSAEQLNVPVIIAHAQCHEEVAPLDKIGPVMVELAKRSKVKVCVHLDHGTDMSYVKRALELGFTSVMFDGSRLDFDENARLTRLASDLAHAVNCSSEGEIGHVAQGDETSLTSVEEAVKFAELTKVDALAVSIGTAHGYYKAEPKLDIARCQAIAEALPEVPLVLHGGSGTPLEQVREAVHNGIAKINIATEYLDTYLKSSRAELEKLDGKFLPVDKFFDPVVAALTAHAAGLIRFFAGK